MATTISGFSFDWILFPNLTGLFKERNNLSRFDCVKDRFGVYIFFENSGQVPYVGLCGQESSQKQDLRKRISQYFKHRQDSGVPFVKRWKQKNRKEYPDYQSS